LEENENRKRLTEQERPWTFVSTKRTGECGRGEEVLARSGRKS
jgi:hypothetical protein